MAFSNLFVLTQVICYCLSFVLSFLVFVPVSINNGEFKGHCLLHATGTWQHRSEPASIQLTNVHWGSSSACNFTVFIGILVMLLSLFYIVWGSIYLFQGTDSSWLGAFCSSVTNILIMISLFSDGITVSGGFSDWCSLITNKLSGIDRCENGDFSIDVDVNTLNYYSEYQIAQFGLWSLWMCWVVLSLLCVIKLYRYHKQETFLSSVSRQRERLLQRVGHQNSYSEEVST